MRGAQDQPPSYKVVVEGSSPLEFCPPPLPMPFIFVCAYNTIIPPIVHELYTARATLYMQ